MNDNTRSQYTQHLNDDGTANENRIQDDTAKDDTIVGEITNMNIDDIASSNKSA